MSKQQLDLYWVTSGNSYLWKSHLKQHYINTPSDSICPRHAFAPSASIISTPDSDFRSLAEKSALDPGELPKNFNRKLGNNEICI